MPAKTEVDEHTERKLATATATIEQLERERDRHRARADDADAVADRLRQRVAELERDLGAQVDATTRAGQALDTMRKQHDAVRSETADTKRANERLRRENTSLKQRVADAAGA